ncbi:hypothetical protein [Streptococcus halichoeri]|nr:hypothetical protein [Streptococcus halichoeri]
MAKTRFSPVDVAKQEQMSYKNIISKPGTWSSLAKYSEQQSDL